MAERGGTRDAAALRIGRRGGSRPRLSERICHLAGGREALVRIWIERGDDDVVQCGGNVRLDRGWAGCRPAEARDCHSGRGIPGERPPAGEHLVQDEAQ